MTEMETSSDGDIQGSDAWEGKKRPNISDLNSYYIDGDSADQDVFAEMRSSVLLVSGEHYNRYQSRFYRRIRDYRELNNEQKLRLTKNHVRKICQIYANNIVSANPGVAFTPKDESSMHDRKVAEMHEAVWWDGHQRYNLDDRIDDWVDSFTTVGEAHVKIFYDPHAGGVKGYEPLVDEITGEPSLNDMQEQIPDENKPVLEGQFVFEEIYGFNLLRPPECKDLRQAEWLGIRKMVNRKQLRKKYKNDEKKLSFILADEDNTFVIFDGIRGGYRKNTNETMIREYYFRPSIIFPKGYFYITTQEGILEEGELPGGIFPIVSCLFDKIPTLPRGRSPVRTMRPYQAEINRSASKIAEHQITLGDDKLLLQNGTKASAGVSLPGVRTVNYTGTTPTILPGRSGDQYLAYMQSQISEMYQVMMVAEDTEPMPTGQLDAYTLLFRSARQKKKFQRYIKKFEKFLIEVVKMYIDLAKIHMPDDQVVYAVGKSEQINIAEFREQPTTCYEVNVQSQSDDIETKIGKQLVLNHTLQYAGNQLKPDDIGKLIRQMPYSNVDESFSDLTMDYDLAENDMLALDRGERPPVNQYDNHPYMIKKLTSRTRKPDFQFLPMNVQQNYFTKITVHEKMEAAKQAEIQRAQAGFIPTVGYMVTCDFYVPDPKNPTKTQRLRIPASSLEWLVKQLEIQGASQASMAQFPVGAQAEIANMMPGQQPQPQQGMGLQGAM